jgi:hypothetical protein
MFRDSTISDNCMECPAGTSSAEASGSCSMCKPGARAAGVGRLGRAPGPAGPWVQPAGSPGIYAYACTRTPSGRGTRARQVRHRLEEPPCPRTRQTSPLSPPPPQKIPGTYAPGPKTPVCQECPRGSFQRSHGQSKCELCPAGTYGDARGRSSCKVCPVGTFNPETGSTSSMACQ